MVNEQQLKNNLARNLRYLRLAKNPPMAQITLAQKLGINKSSLHRYETAQCLPPTHILLAIAQYFGYTMGELLSVQLPAKKGMNTKNENLTFGNQKNDPG